MSSGNASLFYYAVFGQFHRFVQILGDFDSLPMLHLDDRARVSCDDGIMGDKLHWFRERLGEEHAVERIAMNPRQSL